MASRQDGADQCGFANAALARQQGEAGRFMEQAPFERGEGFAMRLAEVQSFGRGSQLEGRSAQAKMMMIHDGIKARPRTTPGELFDIRWPVASATRASAAASRDSGAYTPDFYATDFS